MFDDHGIDPLWHLADRLTLDEAAALIAGYDPAYVNLCRNDTNFEKNFSRLYPVQSALRGAVISGALDANKASTGKYQHIRMVGEESEGYWEPVDELSMSGTRVHIDDLRRWLRFRGFRTGFFFPGSTDAPDYLDSKNKHYAPKLAAAVRAWQAMSADPKYLSNGKTVKQNLEAQLTAHAAEFDLVKDDGEINADAIKNQISKVSNWQDKGGAPTTPGG